MNHDREFAPIKDRIDGLADLIRDNADRSDRQGHLCDEVARAMARADLYRVAAPRAIGGGEYHPVIQIRTIEAIAELDGSAAWNLMVGVEHGGILGAAYPLEFVKELYADPELIIVGAINPLGKAVSVDGGYLVSGQWPFGSGIHNADYFWGQCTIHANGEVVKDKNGPVTCEALISKSELEVLDTWHVSGLRATGSHDVRVKEVLIPDERISQVARRPMRQEGTLYRLPFNTRLAYNKVGVATGIARAAIGHFKDLADEKTPRGFANRLRERSDAQYAIADAEYILGSARSFVFEQVSEIWDTVDRGDAPSIESRAMVQLACSGAATAAVQAVEKIYAAAGATANFVSSPLERCMRDVLVVRQHIMVSPQFKEGIGRALLGLPSGTFLF